MLRGGIEEAAVEVEPALTWAPEHRRQAEARWRTVDRALRAISCRRAALDADEARWLREAEAVQIWRPLGMVSALDYLERVLGYAPRTAQDRLRVARALGALPQLTAALAAGEPTRVVRTPSFIDGIGGNGVLAEMWPLVSTLLSGALVSSVEQVAAAVRLLAERARVIAEGAGAAPLATALAHDVRGKTVCVVSGGNIYSAKLATILEGRIPA
jgi:threonine synthase